jgi:exopolyphosphatase / guanosine-5'-triphosphate,3'-diphosphate pyrophosphatase
LGRSLPRKTAIKMTIAIIDLGTNTCNLLIADYSKKDFNILHQSKLLVQLGDVKMRDNLISNEATDRAIKALKEQCRLATHYQVEKIRIVATSAARTATNRIEFLEKISDAAKCPVKLISGEKEAELIFKGVLLAMGSLEETSVILDIGGGSNEIILARKKELLWKESQPTGMARIINQFVLSDPIKPGEIEILQNYFAARHYETFQQCRNNASNTLIGCSGSFDTIADIIDHVNPGDKQRRRQEITLSDFFQVYQKLIKSTHVQRLKMKGMDSVRVDLIVPAIILIAHLIKKTGISKIIQTDYALREGILFEIMESDGMKI